MARHALLAATLTLAACTSATAPPAPAAGPASAPASAPAPKDPAAALLAACRSRCEYESQARAVAAEIIERDCKTRCETVTGWPLVESGPGARAQLGRDVRLVGELDGAAVRLADGVQVMLQIDPGLVLAPGRVVLAGRLDSQPEGFVLTVRYGAGV